MMRIKKQFLTENPILQNNLAVNITLVGVYRNNRNFTDTLSCEVVCRIIPYDAALYSSYVGNYSIV